jgi:hypothetical protein
MLLHFSGIDVNAEGQLVAGRNELDRSVTQDLTGDP